jgi:hypothetical protein
LDPLAANTFLAGFARGAAIQCWQWERDFGHILGSGALQHSLLARTGSHN